jgi:uncharacterized membrane protein
MSLWLILSLVALFLWGLFGVCANLASRHFDGYNVVVWDMVGAVMVGIFVLFVFLQVFNLQLEPKGVLFGLLTGIALHLGALFMFFALNSTAVGGSDYSAATQNSSTSPTGKVHTILVLTAMYPLIGVILNYFILNEPLSIRQLIGIVIGIGAIVIFMSGE